MPIALQTIVDHISAGYIGLNERLEATDFNKPFSENFKAVTTIKRKVYFEKLFSDKVSEKTAEIIDGILNSIKAQKLKSYEVHFEEQDFDKYFIVEGPRP
jgi:hypothetical protein